MLYTFFSKYYTVYFSQLWTVGHWTAPQMVVSIFPILSFLVWPPTRASLAMYWVVATHVHVWHLECGQGLHPLAEVRFLHFIFSSAKSFVHCIQLWPAHLWTDHPMETLSFQMEFSMTPEPSTAATLATEWVQVTWQEPAVLMELGVAVNLSVLVSAI